MDIFIKSGNDTNTIQIPVLPESYEVTTSVENTSVTIHDLGEINLKGKRTLKELSFESFFPCQNYDFCKCEPTDPINYVNAILSLLENNETVHLIITGSAVNMMCTIQDFSYGHEEATQDLKYSITFKEYREWAVGASGIARASKSSSSGSYKWKKGDTWSKVAKAKTGKSSNASKLKSKNKSVINKATKAYRKAHPKNKVKESTALIGYKVVIK